MTKLAIVHDYLTQTGGAERLALALSDIFPEALIYTSVYAPEATLSEFGGRDIRTTFLQGRFAPEHFRYAAPLYGQAFRSLDLSEFDKVIVSTSGFAHHIKHPNAFVYCHTPPHFLYELDAYMNKGVARSVAQGVVPALRAGDKRAARRHANYVANSFETAEKIRKTYEKITPVIHPPFSTTHLPPSVSALPAEPRALMIGRLMPYKRFDTAIRACHIANVPLTVIGGGPDEARLRSLATELNSNTAFTGRVSDEDLAELWNWHSVALMPGVEDFGFAPLDANYSGRPIVGRNAGGALETIVDGVTGMHVDGDDPAVWAEAILNTLHQQWDPVVLRESTTPFQFPAFRSKVLEWVGESVPVA